jgi:hypothetical protein
MHIFDVLQLQMKHYGVLKYIYFDELFLNYTFRHKCHIYVNDPSSKGLFYRFNVWKMSKTMAFFILVSYAHFLLPLLLAACSAIEID